MATGFLSQTLVDKHFSHTLSFSCPHKTHPRIDLQEAKNNPWEIFQMPNTYEVASNFRTPALKSSGLDICTRHTHSPPELCKSGHLKIWGNSEITFHNSIWSFRKFTEQHQTLSLHFSLPVPWIKAKKQALLSAITTLAAPVLSSVS